MRNKRKPNKMRLMRWPGKSYPDHLIGKFDCVHFITFTTSMTNNPTLYLYSGNQANNPYPAGDITCTGYNEAIEAGGY